jgi:hypothetical protein
MSMNGQNETQTGLADDSLKAGACPIEYGNMTVRIKEF